MEVLKEEEVIKAVYQVMINHALKPDLMQVWREGEGETERQTNRQGEGE